MGAEKALRVGVLVAHILLSLVPEDVTFWIRSWLRSAFSSLSVFSKSSLFLLHRAPVLTLGDDYKRRNKKSANTIVG